MDTRPLTTEELRARISALEADKAREQEKKRLLETRRDALKAKIGSAGAPTTPPPTPSSPAKTTPETPEATPISEELRKLLDEVKQKRFDFFNSGTPEAEEEYHKAKTAVVEEYEKDKEHGIEFARRFLFEEVELKREHHLKSKLATRGERMTTYLSRGIEKWDNWGNTEGVKGYLQRLAKTGISLTAIGVISSLSIEGLAKLGIGTASALSGGITTYLGRRLAFTLGMSGIMATIPDEKKKWVRGILIAGSAGAALAGGGLIAGGALVTSSVIGYGLSNLTKRYDKKIKEKKEEIKKAQLNLATLEADIQRLEEGAWKALEDAERTRILGKLTEAATAVAGSMASLEIFGATSDYVTDKAPTVETENPPSAPISTSNTSNSPANVGSSQYHFFESTPRHDNVPNHDLLNTIKDLPENLKGDLHVSGLDSTGTESSPEIQTTFENGEGGIQGVLDLRKEILEKYPDISKAPEEMQKFMEGSATEKANEINLFNPEDASGKESALIGEGSTLGFDNQGHLILHNTIGNTDTDLTVVKYEGKMFDSDPAPMSRPHTPEPIDPSNLTPDKFSFADPEEARMAEERAMLEAMPPTRSEISPTESPEATGEGISQEQIEALRKQGYDGDPNDREAISRHFEDRATEIRAGLEKKYETGKESELMTDKVKELNAILRGDREGRGEELSESRAPRPMVIDKVVGNPFDLDQDKLRQADQIYQNNIVKLLGDEDRWETIRHEKASDILKNGQSITNDTGVMGPTYNYLQELRKITDLKPQGNWLLGRESVEHFVARAVQSAVEKGGSILEKVQNIQKVAER